MKTYPLFEALKAQQALRTEAGLPPEQFPIPAFVGMISDEVEQLRNNGKSDEQIVALIRQHSSIDITPDELAEHYATPEDRQHIK
jgi:hypothetical protein